MKTAQAYDNRIDRKAAVLDTARPFVAVKPKGFLNPVIGHYPTMAGAKQAAKRFNDRLQNSDELTLVRLPFEL